MSFLDTLKTMDRKFSWSFFGFTLAALLGSITIYDRFVADTHPQLYFDVMTSTAVLDIRENVPKLEVFFDGVNIREKDLALRVISVKVSNESSHDILRGHYDGEDLVGLRVQPGRIIKAELANSSNDYLARNLSFSSLTTDSIRFKDVILEANQYFVIKLLVTHPANTTPAISPLGHVAGMKQIFVREAYKDLGRPSIWQTAFVGSWYVQIARLFAYFIAAVLVAILIIAPSTIVSNKLQERARRRTVREFKGSTTIRLNDTDEFVFEQYLSEGVSALERLNSWATDPSQARRAWLRRNYYRNLQAHSPHPEVARRPETHLLFFQSEAINDAIEAGFLKREGSSISVDVHMKQTLEHFMLFLKNKGLMPKRYQVVEDPARTSDSPNT